MIDRGPQERAPARPMSMMRTAMAALFYAALMTGWQVYEAGAFEASHLLRFVFYALVFGLVFEFAMRVIERRRAGRTE